MMPSATSGGTATTSLAAPKVVDTIGMRLFIPAAAHWP